MCSTLATAAAATALAVDGGTPCVDPATPLPTIANSSGRSVGEEEQLAVASVLHTGNLAYITGTQVVIDGGHLAGPHREPIG